MSVRASERSVLVSSWIRRSSDENIGRGLAYSADGGIPREGLSPFPGKYALGEAQRPQCHHQPWKFFASERANCETIMRHKFRVRSQLKHDLRNNIIGKVSVHEAETWRGVLGTSTALGV